MTHIANTTYTSCFRKSGRRSNMAVFIACTPANCVYRKKQRPTVLLSRSDAHPPGILVTLSLRFYILSLPLPRPSHSFCFLSFFLSFFLSLLSFFFSTPSVLITLQRASCTSGRGLDACRKQRSLSLLPLPVSPPRSHTLSLSLSLSLSHSNGEGKN